MGNLYLFIGINPDPAPPAWLGQKSHRTQRGAALHENDHATIHHRSHNPIVPRYQFRWLGSRCGINALWRRVDSADSVIPSLD